ncbi:hypothetical protein LTR94_025621, partial [Friedmanniomyces endolithicus]
MTLPKQLETRAAAVEADKHKGHPLPASRNRARPLDPPRSAVSPLDRPPNAKRRAPVYALKDKVAVVTGASSGIGQAAARLFARLGAKVVVSARREAELAALVAAIQAEGGEACAVPGDVCDEATAAALTTAAEERFGGLDIAFNNAGAIPETAPTPDLSVAGWKQTLDINLTGAFL